MNLEIVNFFTGSQLPCLKNEVHLVFIKTAGKLNGKKGGQKRRRRTKRIGKKEKGKEEYLQLKSDQTERLLNKPYVNEVTLSEQNLSLK